MEEGRLLDTSRGMVAAVPGWAALRLLAPAADVRLLLAASPTEVDATRLGCAPLHRGGGGAPLVAADARMVQR